MRKTVHPKIAPKDFKIDPTVAYKLEKIRAKDNQISGVDTGRYVQGKAEWLVHERDRMLRVWNSQGQHFDDDYTYIRTSPIIGIDKMSSNEWHLHTENGSTYRLVQLSTPA